MGTLQVLCLHVKLLAYEFFAGSKDQSEQACEADDWQQISHKPCQKSSVAWEKQAYWQKVLFFEEPGSEWNVKSYAL